MIRPRFAPGVHTAGAAEVGWRLCRFAEGLDAWTARERPADCQRIAVTTWMVGRAADPRAGAESVLDIPGLWFAIVPDSLDVRGRVATCSYWIKPVLRLVVCDSVTLLAWPV